MSIKSKNSIIKLPKSVYDKIAAGEVIERPVSVVKELLENSIDADASFIVIEIRKGGKEYIRISDNGHGIRSEEIELAFERHATSKISNLQDLDNISTLGFRGEALSSIVSVAKVEMITKVTDADYGIHLIHENDEILEFSEIGAENGTTIIIKNLFYNLPGRLKFLKADHIEAQLIIDLLTKMALSRPEINLKLINNGKLLFTTGGKKDIKSNIACLYDNDLVASLLEYEDSNDFASLKVFFSNPGYSKANRKYQIFFVNGRYVHNKIIEKALSLAFEERLPKGRYPVAFIFLKISPWLIDVNIHPAKLEIKFLDENNISNFIVNAISTGLLTMSTIPKVTNKSYFVSNVQDNKIYNEASQVDIITLLETKREIYGKEHNEAFNEKVEVSYYSHKPSESNMIFSDDFIKNIEKKQNSELDSKQSIANILVKGSVFNTYILGEANNILYIIDQHAAHERILFEKFKSEYLSSEKFLQTLLIPLVINVTYTIREAHNSIISSTTELGFEIETFGPRSYIVRSIPMFLSLAEAEMFLIDFIDQYGEDSSEANDAKIDKLISNACKYAVKAHDHLDISEMERLLVDLADTDNPFSCPHGRPVLLRLTISEIEKMFKRI